jgi:enoyl-CoA hydratase/carnithine racemase
MTDDIQNSVCFEELESQGGKRIGVATLNVERKLHSLNQNMVGLLRTRLSQWQADDRIACVW